MPHHPNKFLWRYSDSVAMSWWNKYSVRSPSRQWHKTKFEKRFYLPNSIPAFLFYILLECQRVLDYSQDPNLLGPLFKSNKNKIDDQDLVRQIVFWADLFDTALFCLFCLWHSLASLMHLGCKEKLLWKEWWNPCWLLSQRALLRLISCAILFCIHAKQQSKTTRKTMCKTIKKRNRNGHKI